MPEPRNKVGLLCAHFNFEQLYRYTATTKVHCQQQQRQLAAAPQQSWCIFLKAMQ